MDFNNRDLKEVELKSGETIENVTDIKEGDNGMLHIHTPGSGYRVVSPDMIEDEK